MSPERGKALSFHQESMHGPLNVKAKENLYTPSNKHQTVSLVSQVDKEDVSSNIDAPLETFRESARKKEDL